MEQEGERLFAYLLRPLSSSAKDHLDLLLTLLNVRASPQISCQYSGLGFFLLRYRLLELDDLEQPWCRILPFHQLLQKRIKIFQRRECKGRVFPNVSAAAAVH